MEEQAPVLPDPIEKEMPSKVSRNWRQILQLLGAYLVGAWTVLQFLDWIFARYQISPYWVDVFLWIFIGVLPSFLFYLFNKERVDRWQLKRKDKVLFSGNLLTLMMVLFFGFRSADLGATTKEIQYATADGTLRNTTIVKQEFRKTIALFNFEGNGVDSSALWLNSGIRTLIGLDIQQDKAIKINEIAGDFPLTRKIEAALETDFFVDGTYTVANGVYTISPQIHTTKNGKVLANRPFEGTDLFTVLDSISVYIRQIAGIDDELLENATDLPLRAFTSSSLPAVRYFCGGTIASWERAIEEDSTFSLASLRLGVALFNQDVSELDTKFYINQAFRHRHKLPFFLQYSILSYRHIVYNDLEAAEKTLQLQLEIDPEVNVLNENMVQVYLLGQQFDKLLTFTEAWFDRSISAAAFYEEALHLNAKTNRLLKRVKPFLSLYPNNEDLLYAVFKAHLIDQNWAAALEVLQKMKLIRPEFESQFELMEKSIHYQRDGAYLPGQYDAFLGNFRIYNSERIVTFYPHADKDHILLGQINNGVAMQFPLNDQQIFNLGRSFWRQTETFELSRDSTGLTVGMEIKELTGSDARENTVFLWKIDSLILSAESLLRDRAYDEAEQAYQKAIEANPNHYFLNDGLAHVQYVKTKTAAELEEQFNAVAGTYKDRYFWVENGRLFYKRTPLENLYFPRMELLPISENRYFNVTRPRINMAFETQNGRSIASYSYLYNREAKAWAKNTQEEDYKHKD